MLRQIKTIHQRHDGQTMAEYVVVLGVIALAAITAVGVLSAAVGGRFSGVASTITSLVH